MTAVTLAASFFIGMLTGGLYFLLLWRSARGLSASGATPGRLLGGFGLRLLFVATVFAAVIALGAGGTQLAASLVGFMASRLVATRLAAPRNDVGVSWKLGRPGHGD